MGAREKCHVSALIEIWSSPDAACQPVDSWELFADGLEDVCDSAAWRMQLCLPGSLSLGRRCGVSSREALSHCDGLLKNTSNLSYQCGGSMLLHAGPWHQQLGASLAGGHSWASSWFALTLLECAAGVVSIYTLALCGSRKQGKWKILLKMVPVHSLFIQHLLSTNCAPGAGDDFICSPWGDGPSCRRSVPGPFFISLRAVCCTSISPDLCFFSHVLPRN